MRPPVLLAVLLTLCGTGLAWAQSEDVLRGRVEAGKARERSLASAAERLAALERDAAREVMVLEGRIAAVEGELATAQARVRGTELHLAATRDRLQDLRERLAEVRAKLAVVLRERYVHGPPQLLSVVLESDGFPDFLETMTLLRRVQRADARLLADVREARRDTARHERRLTVLAAQRREAAAAVARRRAALAGMLAGLRDRRDALARARAARAAALERARAGRRRARRELSRLLAERARAAVSVAGPGGPWAIPWAVVQCESGGQNLPPNGAGASGYYQFMPETWRGLGGSTPHAYQAPKGEQDRLAARLWAGGSGAHNWVCAELV